MLPDDILNTIIDHLDFYNLLSYCQVSKNINTLCYKNEYFLNIKRKIIYQPIAMDEFNTYYIKNNILYGLGSNRFGQLGLINKYRSNKPIVIDIQNPLSVFCLDGTVAILTDNGLYIMGARRTQFDDHLNEHRDKIPLTKLDTPGKVFYVNAARNTLYIISSYGIFYLDRDWKFIKINIKFPLYMMGNTIMTTHGLYKCIHYYDDLDDIVKLNLNVNIKDINTFLCYYDKLIIATKHTLFIYYLSNHDQFKLKIQYNINNIMKIYCWNDNFFRVFTPNKCYKIYNNDKIIIIKCPVIKHATCHGDSVIIIDDENYLHGCNVNSYGKVIFNKSNIIKKLL
jgi:hypothetical protein